MKKIAVIGGSGLYDISDKLDVNIEQHQINTAFGETSSSIQAFIHQQNHYFFLARHGNKHQLPPHKINYRANLLALKQLGVEQIVSINAVGGINPLMQTGSLVIPDQLIDYTYGREHTFFDGDNLLDEAFTIEQHIDFGHPFTLSLREALIKSAKKTVPHFVDYGCYGVTQGPRFETNAEIKKLANDGCDIVGMTAMPEAALAAELGMDYASLCIVVNPAAGVSNEHISIAAIKVVLETGIQKALNIVFNV